MGFVAHPWLSVAWHVSRMMPTRLCARLLRGPAQAGTARRSLHRSGDSIVQDGEREQLEHRITEQHDIIQCILREKRDLISHIEDYVPSSFRF